MELFVTKNITGDGKSSWLRTEQEGCNHSSTKNAKNGIEQEHRSSTQNGTERKGTEGDGTERERNDKKEEQEQNV